MARSLIVTRVALTLLLLVGALSCVAAAPAAASTFQPDRSFGSRGIVTTKLKGVSLQAFDAIAVGGGKLVVVGRSYTAKGIAQVVVARYLKNGKLDRSFASKGIYKSAFPSSKGPFMAKAVGLQPRTGKIVVAGGYGQGSVLLMRLTSSGKLDKTFGPSHSGTVTRAVGDMAGSMAFGAGGRIIVGSSNQNVNGRPFILAGFTASGNRDSSFGSGGLVQLIFWDPDSASPSGLNDLAVTRGGQIIGSGHLDYIGGDGHGSAGVFRLDSSGRLVESFGTNGHVELARAYADGKLPSWFPEGMTIDSAERITITGSASGVSSSSKGAMLTVRITGSGQPDTSFGPSGDGWATSDSVSDGNQTLSGATPIAGGGLAVGSGNWIAGLTAAGLKNPQFGSAGAFKITRPAGVTISALVSGSSGSTITAAGAAGNALYLARYKR